MIRVDGNPGFTKQSFDYLSKRVADMNHPLVCSLVVDEMDLHEHIQFDGQQFIGGTGNNYIL